MKQPSQEDLLGFVLGALDADEHNQVQHQIENDPQLEEQLLDIKSQIMPLELLDGPTCNRPGLARRTCELIAAIQKDELLVDRPVKPQPAEHREPLASKPSWTLTDFLITAAACGILASLLFPALAYTRHRSQLAGCQNNLRNLGVALLTYSNMNDGKFVEIPPTGNLATAGIFAPILKDAHLIIDDSDLVCPEVDRNVPLVVPTVEQVKLCTDPAQLEYFRRTMAGDYGYSMGYYQNNRHLWPRNVGRAQLIVLADKPSIDLPGRGSPNHRGTGQNCLFEDGHFEFVSRSAFGDDAIYENDYGIVAPGVDSQDSVIGASHHSPSRFENMAICD